MDWDTLLKAVADPHRLRILNLLGKDALCVCHIESVMDHLSQSNLSHHLAKLKKAGLVTASKKGLYIYYSRAELPEPYGAVVGQLLDTVALDPRQVGDRTRLRSQLGCG